MAKSVHCPYCYTELDLAALPFLCRGAGLPGRPQCVAEIRAGRELLIGQSDAVMPLIAHSGRFKSGEQKSCPECGGTTGIRACSACWSRLPQAFDFNAPMIGLVGAKDAGKTVFLSVLLAELEQGVARRFNADFHPIGDTRTYKELVANGAAMAAGGSTPGGTAAKSGKSTPATVEWRMTGRGLLGEVQRSTIFSFYDTAGEELANEQSVIDQRYLTASSGLIFILDPYQLPANRARAENTPSRKTVGAKPIDVLSNVTEMIRTADGVKASKKTKRPIAIVLTKIDEFYDEIDSDNPIRRPAPQTAAFDLGDTDDLHNHVAGLIAEWGGDDVLRHLESNYGNYRLFAASALGAPPSAGGADRQGLRPHRVAEPLLWLMSDFGVVPRAKA